STGGAANTLFCLQIAQETRRSVAELSLAHRAERRRATAVARRADRCAAHPARLARAPVDVVLQLEIAGVAVAVDVVAQRRAPFVDRLGQRRANGIDESCETRPRQALRLRRRADAGAKQRLVRIDVAYADDDMVVHEHELDRGTPSPRLAPEVV